MTETDTHSGLIREWTVVQRGRTPINSGTPVMAIGGERELVWTVVQRGRTPVTSGTPIMATESQRKSGKKTASQEKSGIGH
ncbi:hypothetical protein Pyn_14579 [Prunus yedoensis var. nudiflora]|uniref:Uncharacterized protein n=1 Tax=Prunus yedoensis var. nudiflora TaxID=2094558 RepID=A0A314UB87_PRUYE|nr:hypothetical protein Pyn_14579 [Prunus yedoensis var. nudiflora]